MLIGTITLDYILAFSVLGVAGIFSKKGNKGICFGIVLALALRFICHLISGCVIFKELEQFEIFGEIFVNRPFLYSLGYNGFYMLPEIVITVIGAVILLNLPQTKKIMKI